MKKLCLLVPLLLVLVSCASTEFSGVAACTGRVYGPNGEPVEQYQISFGIGLNAVTGANGMFLLPALRSGTYTVTGKGQGWTPVQTKVDFIDKRGIVCIQVEPMSEVYKKVESYLRSGLYAEAEQLLKKESDGNEKSALFQFYTEVVSYCKNPSERKLKKITEKVMQEASYAL